MYYRTFQDVLTAAQAEDPPALFILGLGFVTGVCHGHVLPQDSGKAFEVIMRAASLGHGAAMVEIGKTYATGFIGVDQLKPVVARDPQAALGWYQRAEAAGEASVWRYRGDFYRDESPEKAAAYYRTGGLYYADPRALEKYAECLWQGEGVDEDKVQARTHLMRVLSMDAFLTAEALAEAQALYGLTGLSIPDTATAEAAAERYRQECAARRSTAGEA